jgi:DNA-binding IclR family transcriptional regulator
MPPTSRQPLAPSTDRCLEILELLSQQAHGLTLSEIHRRLGVSKNMAYRILQDMSARGFVHRDVEKCYFLGRKLLELASPQVQGRNLVDEAAPVVAALRDQCGESAGLLVPNGGEAVLIYFQPSLHLVAALRDQCGESVGLLVPNGGEAVLIYFQPSLHPMRMAFDLGFRIALYCNAPGKVFLAFGDEGERAERLRLQSLERRTPRTITNPKQLAEELEEARRVGYTVDRGEEIEGAHCVAAPVFDRDERLVAALVIFGPSQRVLEEHLPELGRQVALACATLSDRLRL